MADKVTELKTKKDWAKFIQELVDTYYPKAKKITLVLDNYATHCCGAFYETFRPNIAKRLMDKIEFIFTPKHGSWLNMAEIELNVMNKQCLNRHIDNREQIEIEIEAWQNQRNNKKNKINWQFTDKDARIKLKNSIRQSKCDKTLVVQTYSKFLRKFYDISVCFLQTRL
ncbi:MAG: transposase [Saprospiraceae bacterium]|nr:transposase [Saprospiraceae bacterium]